MDFTFSEDAEMIRQTAHQFVRRDLLPQEPKFLNSKDPAERAAIVEAASATLKEMGLYSAGVPETFGGGGLGVIETCLLAEELGQTLIPVEWGELTPILYECSYAVAFNEPAPFADPARMATSAKQSDSGWTLNGTKVLPGHKADFYLVFALAIGPIGPIGPICLIVDKDAPGRNLSSNLLTLSCTVPADRVLGVPGKALGLGRKWFPLTRTIRAAAVLGACDRLLEVNAQYAHDWTGDCPRTGTVPRTPKPIQQALGDMTGDIEALRWLVYHTAWLAAEGKKIEYDSMLLKLQARKVLTDTVNRSVRIHGGTIPPICEWLQKNAASEDATDLLRLAVARETISRLLP
jgi:alkylation response protein AidB-like acyl-CoA dehydrogenase